MIRITCPKCGQRFSVAPTFAGKKVRCVKCSTVTDLPVATASAASVTTSAAATRTNKPVAAPAPGQTPVYPISAAPQRPSREAIRQRMMETYRPPDLSEPAPSPYLPKRLIPGASNGPALQTSPRLAGALVMLGLGGMLLPLIGLHFKLMVLLGPYELLVGIAMTALGILLLALQQNLIGAGLAGSVFLAALFLRILLPWLQPASTASSNTTGPTASGNPVYIPPPPMPAPPPVPTFPMPPVVPANVVFAPRPAATALDGGIAFFDLTIEGTGSGLPMRLWLFLPPGDHSASSVPCVLMRGPGSDVVHGAMLDDACRLEAVRFAQAGVAAVCYEVPGAADTKNPSDADLAAAVNAFRVTRNGITSATIALNWIAADAPEINPARIFAYGRDIAGTTALIVAATDSRIHGVIAVNAPCLARDNLGASRGRLQRIIPDFDQFIFQASPQSYVISLNVPSLICYSQFETLMRGVEITRFVNALKGAGKPVEYFNVARGSESMLIDKELEWIQGVGTSGQSAALSHDPTAH